MASVRENSRRITKWTFGGLCFSVVLMAVVVTMHFMGDKKSSKPVKRNTTEIAIAPMQADFENHEARYNDRLLTLEEETKKARLTNQKLTDDLKMKESQFIELERKFKALERQVTDAKSKGEVIGQVEGNDGWPPEDVIIGKGALDNSKNRKGFGSGKAGQNGQFVKTSNAAPSKPAPGMFVYHVVPPKKKEEKKPVITYLPSGTFAKARLLNGATAPTRGQGSGNPVPVLLELTDPAIMPNLYKAGIQKCFVTAHATGELASERVLIRTDRLSCIDGNGGAVDKKVQGYVTGEDGKTGLSARLVNKSGQAIANALMTGTLSGLGKAVSLASESQTTSITGTVSTTVTNPWRAGFGEGASHAMDRITDYYLKLASDIFPVLEVDSGRQVEVVISQGISIERTQNPGEDADKRSRK